MQTKVVRKIVRIDEEKCDGCGLCIPQCKEGALQIIDGKARLVSEIYCDGLGACLGHCPRGAITVEEREAEEFDERAVHERLKVKTGAHESHRHSSSFQGCPSARVMSFQRKKEPSASSEKLGRTSTESALSQWPVQLALVPVSAPYLQGADLLIVADCVPFSYASFHSDLLEGKKVLVACPKLDNVEPYVQKLARIFGECEIKSITVAHMEVPCCFGLRALVEEALALARKEIPLRDVTISIHGEVCGDTSAE
jgi:NAD-dependent dihydropyrimidine dehydrogenase PreA subunit